MEDLKTSAQTAGGAPGADDGAAPQSRIAQVRAALSLRNIAIVAVIGLVTGVLTVVASRLLWQAEAPVSIMPVTGDQVFALFDAGDDAEAERLAEALGKRNPGALSDRLAYRYVLGVTRSRRADHLSGAAGVRLHREAAEHLVRAAEFGFTEGREDEGLLRLGRSLLYSGQPEASREPLRAALQRGAADRREMNRLLAEACLYEPRSEPKAALAYIQAYLASELSPAERHQGEVLRAEILINSGTPEQREQVLAPLLEQRATRPQALVMQARTLIDSARQQLERAHLTNNAEEEAAAQATYQRAIDLLRKLQADFARDHEVNASAMYLIGICFQQAGDARAALDQFERTSRRYVDMPEGWASLVEAGTLRLALGDDAEANYAFAEALRLSRQMAAGNNRWISQEMLRDRLIAAVDTLVERGNFSEAIELAKGAEPPFPPAIALELQAKANQSWGRHLLAQAKQRPAQQAARDKQQAHEHLRAAGRLFEQLARQRFATNHYPGDRWNTALCYLEAQNYPLAIHILQDYIDRAARRDRPLALVALGRAHLAMGDYAQAVKVLQQCVEFHSRHPAQFEARLILSDAFFEQGDMAAAEQSLLENLKGDLLTPASKEWRESLFAQCRLLHNLGRYDEAVEQLTHALRRYPEDHQALIARYLLADCHLQLANQLDTRLQSEAVEETRRALSAQRRENYEQAVAGYKAVAERFSDLAAARELTLPERAMWTTSVYNRGACLVSLARFRDAIEAYTTAINHDRTAPEALAGFVQIADCWRQLGDRDDAQTALALASVVLDRMPPVSAYAARTGFNRDAWSNYLTWLRTL